MAETTKTTNGILRYPYEAMTDTTDYLQIDISKYNDVGASYIRDRNTNSLAFTFSTGFSQSSITETNKIVVNGGTILLPMPSNIQDTNNVSYTEDTMNKLVADMLPSITNTMDTTTAQGFFQGIQGMLNKLGDNSNDIKEAVLRSLAAQAVNIFGSNVSPDSLLARSQGDIFNPNMELLFSGVTLRSFKFSFKMTPRNKDEANQCKLIIKSFKKNMSPSTGSSNGGTADTSSLYLQTPNVFNLTYKKGNKEHPFLNKFKTCALQDMAVNYTGENVYATYSNGEPISIIMDLTFKELEPIYANDYTDDTNYEQGVGY